VCERKGAPAERVRIDDVYGNHTRPPGSEALVAKFRTNAARSLRPEAIASVERAVEGLADASNLGALSSALRQIS
jgi:hypothetical protein